MPTGITVGVSRKLGQPNFGSHGADCHIDFELGGDPMVDRSSELSEQIRKAFAVCRAEVQRELHAQVDADQEPRFESRSDPLPQSSGTSASTSVNNRSGGSQNGSRSRPASEAQVRAIHAIASKANVTLASHLQQYYGKESPQQLTLRQASELIESLKSRLEPTAT